MGLSGKSTIGPRVASAKASTSSEGHLQALGVHPPTLAAQLAGDQAGAFAAYQEELGICRKLAPRDMTLSFGVVSLVAMGSVAIFAGLKPDAGAEVSGQRRAIYEAAPAATATM